MPIITDSEFGEIVVKRQSLAKSVTARVAPDGRLRITLPPSMPMLAAKTLLVSSRSQIRQLLKKHCSQFLYIDNQQIGKSHNLLIQRTSTASSVKITGTHIIAMINQKEDIAEPKNQQLIREKIIAALRKEAKSYLPRRLTFLADLHGFHFTKSKITHASSRWGSCSSKGTISLNIGLMNLPFELIDYVIIHELCHTRHMNHSAAFWNEVAKIDQDYQAHVAALKNHSPHL